MGCRAQWGLPPGVACWVQTSIRIQLQLRAGDGANCRVRVVVQRRYPSVARALRSEITGPWLSGHSMRGLISLILPATFGLGDPFSDTANVQDGNAGEIAALRANLELCWQMARNASNQDERRSWLDMAESWRLLILTYPPRSETSGIAAPGEGELELGELIRHFCTTPLALPSGLGQLEKMAQSVARYQR